MKRAPWLLLALLWSCGQGADKPSESAPAPGVDPNLRIGHVMIEVGYRLETAGRAAEAESWSLAEYEVQELLEMFQMDMTRARLPGDCNDTVADGSYENLLEQLPRLRAAAENEDATAYASELRATTANCNSCHAGCNVSFIRIPAEVGAQIPVISPAGSANGPDATAEEAESSAVGSGAPNSGAPNSGEEEADETASDHGESTSPDSETAGDNAAGDREAP